MTGVLWYFDAQIASAAGRSQGLLLNIITQVDLDIQVRQFIPRKSENNIFTFKQNSFSFIKQL